MKNGAHTLLLLLSLSHTHVVLPSIRVWNNQSQQYVATTPLLVRHHPDTHNQSTFTATLCATPLSRISPRTPRPPSPSSTLAFVQSEQFVKNAYSICMASMSVDESFLVETKRHTGMRRALHYGTQLYVQSRAIQQQWQLEQLC